MAVWLLGLGLDIGHIKAMKHLGDICKINGSEIAPVDVVIGGSPCQDLSSAGKKAGLAGERSGLFMEQIRVIKEMRAADEARGRTAQFIRPRFMVWENVPGAFSSNKGEDFRIVLEETAKIVQPDAVIPRPAKWRKCGCILGRGWSIAWRVLDAQFWGVPQRRRRIALVADFGGGAAPEILFERKGLSGDTEPGGAPGQTITSGFGGGDKAAGTYCLAGNMIDRESRQNGTGIKSDIAFTLTAIDRHAICALKTYNCCGWGDGLTVTTLTGSQERVADCTAIMCAGFDYCMGAKASNIGYQAECAPTIRTGNPIAVVAHKTVRRFTPLECERLQGFPDGWTDIGAWVDSKGKLHKESSDAARYKALGNSIALPPWRWVLLRLSGQYYRPATVGSLFDGIGGFPLIWEQINGRGTCLWASEVDEFCIAVTMRRFVEEESHGEENESQSSAPTGNCG